MNSPPEALDARGGWRAGGPGRQCGRRASMNSSDPDPATSASSVKAVALREADVRAKLTELGLTLRGASPAEFTQFIKTDCTAWEKIIRDARITLPK